MANNRQQATAVKYDKRDVIEVELELRPTSIVTEFGEIKGPKTKMDILASDLPVLMKYVADEDELDTLKSLQTEFNKRKRKLAEKLEDELNSNRIDSEGKEGKEIDFIRANNPIVEFVRRENREPKPIVSFEILENKGPRLNDMQAKDDRDKNLMATMIEFMKQNSELIQTMAKQQQNTNNNSK